MLYIAQTAIELQDANLLHRYIFRQETLAEDFEISGGKWICENGNVTGSHPDNGGGLLYSQKCFPGNICLDFTCRAVPPCKNDLNFTWRADGWDYQKNDASRGYIGGLGGWWEGKSGMEKYPLCKPWAATPLFSVESGRTYHVQAGDLNGHCFLFVDGQLILEMKDDTPETLTGCERVGLGVYASQVTFGPLSVYHIQGKARNQAY